MPSTMEPATAVPEVGGSPGYFRGSISIFITVCMPVIYYIYGLFVQQAVAVVAGASFCIGLVGPKPYQCSFEPYQYSSEPYQCFI